MAGTPPREVMTVAEAKARLLELSQKKHSALDFLASPAIRQTVMILAGALLGSRVISGRKDRLGSSLSRILIRAAMAVAPLLVQELLRAFGSPAAPTTPRDPDAPATKATPDAP